MSTGLAVPELKQLDRAQKLTLAEWQAGKSGSNGSRLWLPGRIRRMPLEARMQLALDPDLDRAWEVRERRRVQASAVYFTREYGAVQPEEGEPIPFAIWDEQEQALIDFHEERRVIVLKARQLGLTWLAIHYALWIMAYCVLTANARVLALSKKGDDANKIVDRARKVNDLLPPFLGNVEAFKTRDSNSRFRLRDRGSEMLSLMGTPEAARSETATLAIYDEMAFGPNEKAGPTWTALLATLGELGRVIAISTGNGRTGNGAAFSKLWEKARGGSGLHPIFLPYDVDPARRREGWRDAKREEFLTAEEFEAEYPENEEQALQSAGSFNVYSHEGIAAAEKLGRALDAMLPELLVEGTEIGTDWGDFQTFTLWAIPLPGGGVFIYDELVQAHTEPGEASEAIVYRAPAGQHPIRITKSYADSAPKGTNRTFARVLREAHDAEPNRFPDAHRPVPFSKFKEGGGERGGVNTVAYIQHLLRATAKFAGEPDEAYGVIAVSPRCKTLPAQLRNLERDAKDGKVKKPALDPRHVERGDHGADALVALLATRAARWRASVKS